MVVQVFSQVSFIGVNKERQDSNNLFPLINCAKVDKDWFLQRMVPNEALQSGLLPEFTFKLKK